MNNISASRKKKKIFKYSIKHSTCTYKFIERFWQWCHWFFIWRIMKTNTLNTLTKLKINILPRQGGFKSLNTVKSRFRILVTRIWIKMTNLCLQTYLGICLFFLKKKKKTYNLKCSGPVAEVEKCVTSIMALQFRLVFYFLNKPTDFRSFFSWSFWWIFLNDSILSKICFGSFSWTKKQADFQTSSMTHFWPQPFNAFFIFVRSFNGKSQPLVTAEWLTLISRFTDGEFLTWRNIFREVGFNLLQTFSLRFR